MHDIIAELAKASLRSVDLSEKFTIETDASDTAIAAVLSQNDSPVAYFSRTLSSSERHYVVIEKEALALYESIIKWKDWLQLQRFTVITDQKANAFIFTMDHPAKIKNDKIQRWRADLMGLDFEVKHRPGSQNVVADTLSRANCQSVAVAREESLSKNKTKVNKSVTKSVTYPRELFHLHEDLNHPGMQKLYSYTQANQLPFTLSEIQSMTNDCHVCRSLKPSYARVSETQLIKSTAPLQRISIDF